MAVCFNAPCPGSTSVNRSSWLFNQESMGNDGDSRVYINGIQWEYLEYHDILRYILRGRKLFGFLFFSLGIFFWISGSHHFPCYLQHFGAGNCHFHGMCNGFEFEPLIFHCIFHGICNSLQHVLSIFHALCSIFELESAFPPYVQHFTATFLTVLAGFWS